MIERASLSARALLYVPANVERFVAGARRHGADAVILDLEDAVAANEKARARAAVARAAEALAGDGVAVFVRVNRPLALAVADIAASVGPHVVGLVLPKVSGADHVRLLVEVIEDAERRCGLALGATRVIPMIETAAALGRIDELARAGPRVVAITLGNEDLAAEFGVEPDSPALLPYHAHAIAAAVAAGVVPLGLVGSLARFADRDAFAATARRSRALGYRGAACIHPAQIPILADAFSPTSAELERARAVVAAYDAALADGRGAVAFDGGMLDAPVAARARALLRSGAVTPSHHVQ